MIQIKELSIKHIDSDKPILKNITLDIIPGENLLISGKNGSGKSTFAETIMGNPDFEITQGSITLKNSSGITDIAKLQSDERSHLGIFLSFQNPLEIPGVPLRSFLRQIYNAKREKKLQLPVFKFKKILEEKAELLKFPHKLLERNLNEGFSGGEKKKTEILQMLLLEPKYVFFDEVDSGLDKNARDDVFKALQFYKTQNKEVSYIFISHYEEFIERHFKIDTNVTFFNGTIDIEKL